MIKPHDAIHIVVFSVGLMTIGYFVVIKPIAWLIDYHDRICDLIDEVRELRASVYVIERNKRSGHDKPNR